HKCIACGSAGVLKKEFERGSVVVVSSAVRDEGTSYHYLPPSREVAVDQEIVKIIESTLGEIGVPYLTGKTWTTDAIYRETRGIIEKRLSEGCLTVEMEASALIAISRFRKIKFGQILSCGDDVSGEEWDRRFHPEAHTHKEKLFWLAVECCLDL
ncbi:MAG: nucleoside phosphorylase, partial [bacterium]